MNANQMINMAIRMVMRRVMRTGLNAGIDAASRKFSKGAPDEGAAGTEQPARRQAPQQGGAARKTAKRSRQAMKVARRIGRM